MDSKVRDNRRRRVRVRIFGTAKCPRAVVYRSNQETGLQLIDDEAGATILAITSQAVEKQGTKLDLAREVGKTAAALAKEQGIGKIVFDRAGYQYHGRVKALAEALRAGGLEF